MCIRDSYNTDMGSSEYIDVRPSPIAGSWYPGKAGELRAQVEAFLEKASPPALSGEILGLVVPHAGLVYSGFTAAHAFKTLIGSSFTRVILLSPSHQYYREPLLTSGHEAYATPLGPVPVDLSLIHISNLYSPAGMKPMPPRLVRCRWTVRQ